MQQEKAAATTDCLLNLCLLLRFDIAGVLRGCLCVLTPLPLFGYHDMHVI